MQMFESKRINRILGKEIFKEKQAYNDEVLSATGLTIEQLIRGFIFSSANGFTEELKHWQSTGKPMRVSQVFTKKQKISAF